MKCALKLVFLKCIFEFMINTVPPALNSVYAREKLFWYPKIDFSNHVCHVQISRVRLLATLFLFLCTVIFSLFRLFFNTIFPFGLFFFILTEDPAGQCPPGSIYILSLSPEFYFEKRFQKLLICILAKLTTR